MGAGGTTTVVRAVDVAQILRGPGIETMFDELIARLTDALVATRPARCRLRPRDGFAYELPTRGLLEWMPAMEVGRVVAVKMVGYHPANPANRACPPCCPRQGSTTRAAATS